jgi:hypothetical protein
MVKPNNPYSRPINATKGEAMTVGEYYGQRATDKTLNHAAGGRDVSPASRYQAVGHAPVAVIQPALKPKAKRTITNVISEPEAAVTAEDLFG